MTSLPAQIPTKTRQTRLAWTQIYKPAKSNVCHVERWTRNISSLNSTVTIDPTWGARKRACQDGVRMEKVNRLHHSNSATEGTYESTRILHHWGADDVWRRKCAEWLSTLYSSEMHKSRLVKEKKSTIHLVEILAHQVKKKNSVEGNCFVKKTKKQFNNKSFHLSERTTIYVMSYWIPNYLINHSGTEIIMVL